MSGRSPPLYCTLILITMRSHQSYHNITTVIHSYEYSTTVCFSYSAHWLPTRKKLLYTVANPARGLLNREKKNPPPPRAARSEKKIKKIKKITRRIHMSRRYASRRYAGGLGPSRIRTRIPTTRQLGQWMSLRKTLRFRVRL